MQTDAAGTYIVADTHDHERRFDRGAWLTLVFGLGTIIFTLLLLLVNFATPSDGWWSQEVDSSGSSSFRFLINQSGRPSPIREGDVLLAVNGRGPETFAFGVGPIVSPGEPIVFTMERDGRLVEVLVSPVPRRPAGILQVVAYNWRSNPLSILAPVIFFAIGAFAFLMRPGNSAARYLFLLSAFFLCLVWNSANVNVLTSLQPPARLWIHGLLGGYWIYLFYPWLILLVLVFPRPIGPLRRYPRLFPAFLYGLPFTVVLAATIPYLLSRDPADLGLINLVIGWLVLVMTAIFLVTFVASSVHRFRAPGSSLERAQLRWFALGMTLGVGGMLLGAAIAILDRVTDLDMGRAFPFSTALILSSVLFLPLCLGVAILRYRLFDIDVIIRKTLQYTVVTGLLLLVYFSAVVVLQQVFTRSFGWDATPVVVLSTLLIAALFNPVRRRVQNAVDRRFFRKKYDAEKVLQGFAATARDETDLDALTAELLRVIQETMQPASVSMWLRPTGDEGLNARTQRR